MSNSVPTNVAAVANEFLELQESDPGFPPIDQMKIQKLVYYAHAWHLGLHNGTPLFDEDIFAWSWGPVVPAIYNDFKWFGRKPIKGKHAMRLEKAGDGPLNFQLTASTIKDEESKAFVKLVWDTHKHLTGVELSNATHGTGEPWTLIKDKYESLDTKPLIPNSLIAAIFLEKANRAAAASNT